MVSGFVRAILLLSAAGCTSQGLLPTSEKTAPQSRQTPTLSWISFPPPEYEPLRERITEVSYDLRIWESYGREPREWAPDRLAYSRSRLPGPMHRVELPLAPETPYVWSVRARFKLDGEWRLSPWSAESSWDRRSEIQGAGYARLFTGLR
jgi:hypothetical protein